MSSSLGSSRSNRKMRRAFVFVSFNYYYYFNYNAKRVITYVHHDTNDQVKPNRQVITTRFVSLEREMYHA